MLKLIPTDRGNADIPKEVYEFITPRKILNVNAKSEKWGHNFIVEFPEKAIVGVDGVISFITDNGKAELKDWVLFGWIKKLIERYSDNTELLSVLLSGAIATWILQQGDMEVAQKTSQRIEAFIKSTITF